MINNVQGELSNGFTFKVSIKHKYAPLTKCTSTSSFIHVNSNENLARCQKNISFSVQPNQIKELSVK